MDSRRWLPSYAAVACTACAVLLLELGLTRLFSVVFSYHFAFLAISIALFGLGAGGVLSYWIGRGSGSLGWLSLIAGPAVLASLWVVLQPVTVITNERLAIVYFTAAAPFIFAGAILSNAMSGAIDRIDRVYFADLAGASLGCLLLVWLLDTLGGVNTILCVSALLAIAAVFWFLAANANKAAGLAAAVALAWIALIAANAQTNFFDIRVSKGNALTDEIFVKWNSFSRIAARQEKGWGGPAIVIDGDANTSVSLDEVWNWPTADRRNYLLSQEVQSAAYILRPKSKTLIIGSGGGQDISFALASGAPDVTAVEINPIIVDDLMRGRFAAISKGVYLRPEVRVAIEDGRSYIRRSRERYSVIQATMVDTWASTAAGAFALSENNLYTVEAFTDYLSHLNDDGILAFTRWGFEQPRESLRVVSLAVAALEKLGEKDPARHIAVIREGTREQIAGIGGKDGVIVSRKPLTAADLATFREISKPGGRWQLSYLPGANVPSAFTDFLSAANRESWIRSYRYDVSPVTDDRPFFFYTVQPRDVWNYLKPGDNDAADFKINRAVPTLYGLVLISLFATVVTLLLPAVALRARIPRRGAVLKFLLYFAAIGAGFILIEVALIQKFVLFLGHPTYSLTVIVFALLASSGLGSFLSRHRAPRPLWIAAAGAIAAFTLSPILHATATAPLAIKVLISVLLVTPLGILMGMPFPWGLKTLESWQPNAVRWAWSVNAASSVLGSALAIIIGLYLGLTATILLGAALYIAAWALGRYGMLRAGSAPES
ncbi:MAG: hypothetical protein ACKV2U_12675 [Bryobacteraceae bacterium]